MSSNSEVRTETLEPIAYLARSENRLQVLEALTKEDPNHGLRMTGYEPRELRDMTGASEATVSRILNELQERGWAQRDGKGEYTATPTGYSIAMEFAPLIDSMEAISNLGDAVALLPLRDLSIGLQHFGDAMLREPQGPFPRDVYSFLIDLLADSSTYYALTEVIAENEMAEEVIERVKNGSLEFCWIGAEDAVEFVVDEYGVEPTQAVLNAGATVYTYDGDIPSDIRIFDETVVFEDRRVDDVELGTTIVTQDAVVRDWALNLFERYREEASEAVPEELVE